MTFRLDTKHEQTDSLYISRGVSLYGPPLLALRF